MLNLATTQPTQIQTWWEKWPSANIGVVPAPDYFVFDIDPRHNGHNSFKKLLAKGLEPTHSVDTPGGGWHLYYRHPGGGVIKASDRGWERDYPGVDVRADGAFVVGPGSVVGVKEYKVSPRDSGNFSSLPPAVIKILAYKSRWAAPLTATDLAAASQPADYQTLPDVIRCGRRNSYLWGLACSLVARKKTSAQINEVMSEAYKRLEQPPGDKFPWETAGNMIIRALSEYGEGEKPKEEQPENSELLRADHPSAAITAATPLVKPEVTNQITLAEALKRFILISDGAKVADLQAKPKTALLSLEHWKNTWGNLKVQWGKKEYSLPKAWMLHPKRLNVFGETYYPGPERLRVHNGHTYYNNYIPPALKEKYERASDIRSGDRPDQAGTFFDHLEYLFENNWNNVNHFLNWMAFTVRRPAVRIPWCPLIIGEVEGTGKSSLFYLMQRLSGEENCHMVYPTDLSPARIGFNEWVGGTLVCFDEINPVIAKGLAPQISHIITETKITINNKYGKKENREIFTNTLAFSNHENALKLGAGDRRWWIIVTHVQPRSPAYYRQLTNWIRSDGPAYLLGYLLQRDLSGFNYAAPPPVTVAKRRLIEASRSDIDGCLADAFELEQGPFKYDLMSQELAKIYVQGILGLDRFDRSQSDEVSKIVNKMSDKFLIQDKYTIELPTGAKKRVKIFILRNEKKWAKAEKKTVCRYYQKMLEGL